MNPRPHPGADDPWDNGAEQDLPELEIVELELELDQPMESSARLLLGGRVVVLRGSAAA